MRVKRVNPAERKGWYAGPWNSDLTIAVGYANQGIDAPHLHRRITEVYLVARGWSEARVEREPVQSQAGDVLIVEPGESHSFLASFAFPVCRRRRRAPITLRSHTAGSL